MQELENGHAGPALDRMFDRNLSVKYCERKAFLGDACSLKEKRNSIERGGGL
jgi:hypothetical protein